MINPSILNRDHVQYSIIIEMDMAAPILIDSICGNENAEIKREYDAFTLAVFFAASHSC